MNTKDLKKLLAGVGIASLLTGLPLTSGTAIGGSGWGAKDDSAVSAEKEEKAGGSGWGAKKEGAVSTEEEEKEHAEEKEEKAGGSGWGGSK